MAMNTNMLRSVVEPVLNTVFDGLYNQQDEEWSKLFKPEKAEERRWQEDAVLAGLGNAVEKAEGASITYDEGREAYRVRYSHRVYGLAFALTEEMAEDAEHISIGATFSEHLARSMKETKELVHADIINRAFDPTQTGGDGAPLIGTHALAGGGSFSNTLQVAVDLSEVALEEFRASIRVSVDERGKRINLKQRKLIVSPINLGNATRIVKSEKRAGTADNDMNFVSGFYPEGIMEYTRLTNDSMWFVQTDATRGLRHFVRRKIKRGMETHFDTGNARYKASERYSAGWTDPRCLWGSEGV